MVPMQANLAVKELRLAEGMGLISNLLQFKALLYIFNSCRLCHQVATSFALMSKGSPKTRRSGSGRLELECGYWPGFIPVPSMQGSPR